jgi:hypothetical protein
MALGTGPLGYGDPNEADEPPEDAQYLSTWVSPATKDYEIDPVRGCLAEVPPIRGRVLYCITQKKRSSALLPDDGIEYPTIVDETFDAKLRAAVRGALRQLTDVEKVVRIDSITIDARGPRSQYTLRYTDLTTGLPDSVRF